MVVVCRNTYIIIHNHTSISSSLELESLESNSFEAFESLHLFESPKYHPNHPHYINIVPSATSSLPRHCSTTRDVVTCGDSSGHQFGYKTHQNPMLRMFNCFKAVGRFDAKCGHLINLDPFGLPESHHQCDHFPHQNRQKLG